MPVSVRAAVIRNVNRLKKTISEKFSEMSVLKRELQRYKSVLALLSQNGAGQKARPGNNRRRSGAGLDAVLSRLPDTFRSKDFMKAARAKKSAVYLRQVLSRWAKQGRIKRLERGKYQKAKRTGGHRPAA